MQHDNSEVKCERKTECEQWGVKLMDLYYKKILKTDALPLNVQLVEKLSFIR